MGKCRSFTVMELIVVFCLIAILTGTFANYAANVLKIGKETALRNELASIRMSIEHFRIINARLPVDLRELVNKELTSSREDSIIQHKHYIKPIRLDDQGFMLDPYNNRYIYASWDGSVHSGTDSFKNW